jgi:predicted nucleic acid-binding protein
VGIILDSSIVISAERRGDTVAQLLRRIANVAGDQEVALSAVGLMELMHGIYRADSVQRRTTRELFINELIADIEVYPFSKDTAVLAGKIDGEQQAKGIVIPFADLLIGATALLLGYSVVTVNDRDFKRIPGLNVTKMT